MKKVVVIASCALLSAPVFAKGFMEQMTQVKKHTLIQQSANQVDFSGHWEGTCDNHNNNMSKLVLDITQNKDKLTLTFQDQELPQEPLMVQEYTFNSVNLSSSSSPHRVDNFMSYADWTDEHTVNLEYHGSSFISQGNNSSYKARMETSSEFAMSLQDNNLTIALPMFPDHDNQQQFSCVLHKG